MKFVMVVSLAGTTYTEAYDKGSLVRESTTFTLILLILPANIASLITNCALELAAKHKINNMLQIYFFIRIYHFDKDNDIAYNMSLLGS